MKFEFLRYRFRFRSAGTLHFPPGKAANVARGAFGGIFRKLVCDPTCRDSRTCDAASACPYARIFSPRAAPGHGPSGFSDQPRPFVFRAAHLDGCTIPEGQPFHFDVHLFDVRDPALPYFVEAFSRMGQEGLGPSRARVEFIAADQLPGPTAIELADNPETARHGLVRFLTPTELKSGREVVERPEFAILFARLRDRISMLRSLYGDGPLEIDFRAMGEAAAAIQMGRCELQHVSVERRSSRTARRHPLGGFVGEVEYHGDLAPFMSYLKLGKWIGVGRQTVWGKGEIKVEVVE